jgi:hypothetical protein
VTNLRTPMADRFLPSADVLPRELSKRMREQQTRTPSTWIARPLSCPAANQVLLSGSFLVREMVLFWGSAQGKGRDNW